MLKTANSSTASRNTIFSCVRDASCPRARRENRLLWLIVILIRYQTGDAVSVEIRLALFGKRRQTTARVVAGKGFLAEHRFSGEGLLPRQVIQFEHSAL